MFFFAYRLVVFVVSALQYRFDGSGQVARNAERCCGRRVLLRARVLYARRRADNCNVQYATVVDVVEKKIFLLFYIVFLIFNFIAVKDNSARQCSLRSFETKLKKQISICSQPSNFSSNNGLSVSNPDGYRLCRASHPVVRGR